MSIFINRDTRVIVQGITGRMARFHTKDMLEYGTNVVAGVVPGKGGETVEGVPVFNTVKDAVSETGATASLVFVPPPFAADSIMEASDAGIQYCVCITDGIPAQDMIQVKRYMMRYPKEKRMVLTGPNCAGTISPGKAILGIMPGHIYLQGHVGIVGRSGTLGYEAAAQLKDRPAAVNVAALAQISFVVFLLAPPLLGVVAEYIGLRYAFAICMPLTVLSLFSLRSLSPAPSTTK